MGRMAPGCCGSTPASTKSWSSFERRGMPMAVVTQKYRYFEVEGVPAGAAVELEELGLAGRIPVLIGIDDVTKTKPHPEGVLKALHLLGVAPERALMVGDTLADIGAAKAAGCWSCLATWGVPDPADRAALARPEFVAASPGDLLDILGFAVGTQQPLTPVSSSTRSRNPDTNV